MTKYKMVISLGLVLLIGVLAQVMFVFADIADSPSKAALEFTKACLAYDQDTLDDRLCGESRVVDDVNLVDKYIYEATQEAQARGYDLGIYVKNKLYHGDTETIEKTHESAIVRVTGETKSPLRSFFWKGEDESRHVDATLMLVKENGRWKVCGGQPFSLIGSES